MSQHNAAQQLETTFRLKPTSARAGMQTVGVFGDDVPLSLLSALNIRPVCVKAAAETHSATPEWLEDYLEPFMDEYAQSFLSRLANEEFQHLGCLIFCRDDAAAFTAYQYAKELYRQKLLPDTLPPLYLWNLTHTDSQAVHHFNCKQLDKLNHFLQSLTNHSGEQAILAEDALKAVLEEQQQHQQAIDRLHAACHQKHPCITGNQAFQWRNAGRWLDRKTHTQWLNEALDTSENTRHPTQTRRIALVGGAVIDTRIYSLIETLGTIVCEQHLFGELWPNNAGLHDNMPSMIRSIATDTRHPRSAPPKNFPTTVLQEIENRSCDLVVIQCSLNDDSFGWEVPRMCKALDKRSITHVNLGFCPTYPDKAWFESSHALLAPLFNKADAL